LVMRAVIASRGYVSRVQTGHFGQLSASRYAAENCNAEAPFGSHPI